MADKSLLRDLAIEIREGRVVAMVGAGVSMAATGGAPEASWMGLLALGVERCDELDPGWGRIPRLEIASGDIENLLSAAEKVTRKLGGHGHGHGHGHGRGHGRGGGQYRELLTDLDCNLTIHQGRVNRAARRLKLPEQ